MSASTGPSSAVTTEASSMWRRGTTSTCSGAAGLMSLKATVVAVSCTRSEGTSPATILQKRQSGFVWVSTPVTRSCPGVAVPLPQPDHWPDHWPELTGRRVAPVTMGAADAGPAHLGWSSTAATVPVRSETSRAPAVTAAVSARSTLRPKPTVGSPAPSSAVLHPPSGPTATTRWAGVGRSPLSCASTTSPGPPSDARSAKLDGVGHLGQPDPAALRRGLPGHAPQALHRRPASRTAPAHHAALRAQRDDAVDAQLGQFLHHPLRTLALDRSERHRERRLRRRLGRHGAGVERRQFRVALPGGAGPATAPVGDDDLLAGP